MRRQIDLNTHINKTITRGNAADFPVVVRPVFHDVANEHRPIPTRRAIVREDTGEAIAIVSDRYTLVPHSRILEIVEQAIAPLDVGPVPRGVYVDHGGARMRAVFKFPALAKPILGDDEICPCLQIRNTYDGTARIALHIGAFRFVCTNLAVGGGGAFAGGFVSIHAGEIPIEKMADRLVDYLSRFDQIIRLYRQWSEEEIECDRLESALKHSLQGRFGHVRDKMLDNMPSTVFDAYNRLTDHATHCMRSARTAFDMLERVNSSFQELWPAIEGEVIKTPDEPAGQSATRPIEI
jgi:hypothetical protein